jgi:von Willebrand factor type A domain
MALFFAHKEAPLLTLRTLAVVFGTSVTMLAAACGSGDGSEFGNGGNGNGDDPNKDPNNGGNNVFGDSGAGGEGGLGELQACATSSADGQLKPVNIVFMFDQSGSMGDSAQVKAVKWDPVVQAMGGFFNDKQSSGLSGSLAYFPADQAADSPEDTDATCQDATYAAPEVAMTVLPSGTFATSLAAHTPNGGTPTRPAIRGAIAYAKTIAAQKPTDKVVIVLVTDGDPNDCSSSVQNVVTEATGAAATIPTYVIGVGNSIANMNKIAVAGGTKQAIIVDVTSASGTSAAFQQALATIRGQAGTGCSFALPPPPAGKTLDINAVNVVYTAGGKTETLTYNKDCTGGTGWHYDNASSPTSIQLCQATCDTVKAAAGGKVSIAFGCATKGGVVK